MIAYHWALLACIACFFSGYFWRLFVEPARASEIFIEIERNRRAEAEAKLGIIRSCISEDPE